jgi:importin subunit alpha-6/7
MFPELIKNVYDENIDAKHRGVIGIRKIISVEHQPPIQTVIDAKLIPVFIEMSKQNIYPQLQLEATWILTNVCSGTTDQCESVI